jgi:hypothetical protein
VDPVSPLAGSARVVRDAHAGVVLSADGSTEPLPGMPDHHAPRGATSSQASNEPDGGVVSESELEETGTGEAAKRIGQAPTTTDVTDPERSSRNTAAGSGSEPGEGPVQPAADEGVDPSASIEPHNEGLV